MHIVLFICQLPFVSWSTEHCLDVAAALAPNMPARVAAELGGTRLLQPASTLRALPRGTSAQNGVSAVAAFVEQDIPGLRRLQQVLRQCQG